MSPSEDELRAALHQGEQDSINTESLISRARQAQLHRRRTRRTIAGSVLGVAAVAGLTTAVMLHHPGPGDESSAAGSGADSAVSQPASSAAGTSAAASGGGPSSAAGGGAAPEAGRDSSAASTAGTAGPGASNGSVSNGSSGGSPACPSQAPTQPKGGGLSSRFTGGNLVSTGTNRFTVCLYPAGGGAVTSTVLSGSTASALASTLNASKALPKPPAAPPPTCSNDRSLVLLPSVDGRAEPEVVGLPAWCGSTTFRLSNGSAVRYVPDTSLAPAGVPFPQRKTPGPGPAR
jgi:hypothetical protein